MVYTAKGKKLEVKEILNLSGDLHSTEIGMGPWLRGNPENYGLERERKMVYIIKKHFQDSDKEILDKYGLEVLLIYP